MFLAYPVQGDETNNELKSSTACDAWGHCWQPGEQTYELDRSVGDALLSIDDLRRIYESTPGDPYVARRVETVVSMSPIQLVSYDEPNVDDQDEAVPDEKQGKADAEDAIQITENGNIYFNWDVDKLREMIAQQKEAIQANTQLSDAVRASRLQILTSANEELLRLLDSTNQNIQYKKLVNNVEEDQETWQARLQNISEPLVPKITGDTMSEQLAKELIGKQGKLQAAKANLGEIEKQMDRLSGRITQIPAERSSASENLEQIQEEIAERSTQADAPDHQLALLLLEVRRRAAKAELEKLKSEEARQEQGVIIDTLQRDFYSREVSRLQDEVANWEKALKRLRKNEVREDQLAAREEAENAHWLLSPLAQRNEVLVRDRRVVLDRLQRLNSDLETIVAETESIIKRRTEITNKIEAAGLTGTNGMELVDLRRNLQSTGESHIQIRELQTELRRVNLSKVGLNEERDGLADLAAAVQKELKIGEQHVLFPNAIEFMESKREYLFQLIKDYQSYGRKISEVSEARKKLIDEINETIIYIDENAIWIRSAEPISIADVKSIVSELDSFFDSDSWAELVASSQQRALKRPYELSFAAFVFVVLVAINRRVKRYLLPQGEVQ